MQEKHAPSSFSAIAVAPTYNNAGTLAGVLSGVARLGLPILIVDDGSTDATRQVLRDWLAEHTSHDATVLTHSHNRGKAAALRTAFAQAMKLGHTHAVTIDTDAQHDPRCIPRMIEIARESPEAYVLGVRNCRTAGYPRRSRLGRRLSNLLIRLECGLKVADSQCGLRVYPLELVKTVTCRAHRFSYEAEMITRAGWSGCPVIEVPVNTSYLPAGKRVSHFDPWWDTIRGIGTHARLIVRAIMPVPHRKYRPAGKLLRKRVTAREILRWLNPLRAWREVREGAINRTEFAAALAVGVFVANLPVYPFQTALCLYLARRLHLNPLAVLAGSQISTPPVGLALIAAAIYTGHLLLHGNFPILPDLGASHAVWQMFARPLLVDWLVGGPVVGLLLAVIVFCLANQLYRGVEDELETEDESEPAAGPINAPPEQVL
ncbi:MAG TPA: DUF2062 domain-containing protein [Tepidisphaeraceae bacterium]|nr:DUF2062 domain-containing protein [Tepidisphaeraceae bacterium]